MRKWKNNNSDLDWTPEDDPTPDMPFSPAQDEIEPATAETERYRNASAEDDVWTGLIHPSSMLNFFKRRFFTIASTAAVTMLLGFAVYVFFPAKYTTKALVLVDPRTPRVTATENVLSGIGGDAAALTSYVEIMNSDGFLAKVVDELKVADDPNFANVTSKTGLINAFRSSLSANRQGATYIVEVKYKASSGEKAAKYANGVAEAFVRDQHQLRSEASLDASQWLSKRLADLQQNLKKSEDAVAAYQARIGVIGTSGQGTVDDQQLANLVEQIGVTTNEVADAKARYEQAQKDGVPASASINQSGQFTNLDQLLQEQDRLRRQAAELNQTLGSRHPAIRANGEQQKIIAAQITRERSRLVKRTKQAYDTAKAKQVSLERQLADARQRAIQLNKSKVELSNLERQASANRNIYEEFLARYKITDEQSQLQINDARVVSAATVPVKSTKPSIKLVLPVLAVLGLALGLLVALIKEAFASPPPNTHRRADMAEFDEQEANHLTRPAEAYLQDTMDEDHEAHEELEREAARLSPPRNYGRNSGRNALSRRSDMIDETAMPDLDADADVESEEGLTKSAVRAPTRKRSNPARRAANGMREGRNRRQQPESYRNYREDAGRHANIHPFPQREQESLVDNADLDEAILLTLPPMDGDSYRDDAIRQTVLDDQRDRLDDILADHVEDEACAILVTSARNKGGQELTTDLVRDYAIEAGFHPVIISLLDTKRRINRAAQGAGGSMPSRQPNRQPSRLSHVQEYEEFDVIPFSGPLHFDQRQQARTALARELSNLIEVCKDNYGFVILETQKVLEPSALNALAGLVNQTALVLHIEDLTPQSLEDWADWAHESQVNLVLDQSGE